ncbi:hypothetical protein ACLOJK_012549 [Asimina triloba]
MALRPFISVRLRRSLESAANMQGKKLPRLVFFPVPLQGHMNPMLQLATLLHSKGFSITIIHTHLNSPNPSNFPNFNFEPIPDGLSEIQTSTADSTTQFAILNDTCRIPLSNCLSRLLSESDGSSIKCIISDALFHCTHDVATHLGLHMIVLRTNSPTAMGTIAAYKLLCQKGYISVKEHHPDALVPEFPPLRVKDLPEFGSTNPDELDRLTSAMRNATRASSALLFNTLECLEQTTLEKLRQDFHPLPIFAIGPLHKFSPGSSNSLLAQDQRCMAWLDKQRPRSVVYVSFGSLASIKKAELVEIAWGLANSDQAFLWVIRPGSIDGLDWAEVAEDFEERTRDRGLIIKWAPQVEVLSHPSVGGFWTHNGWNSTLESICAGVPMICSPCLWDQMVNARYVSHVWRVGLQLENGFRRDEIERTIRRLMGVTGTEDKRIRDLKESAMRSMRKGGSSFEDLEALVDLLLSF